ncbi:MAG: MFS transporter [Chloroflexi bacterium]|nr:MFS transporter [Chloroflexota bacterium]
MASSGSAQSLQAPRNDLKYLLLTLHLPATAMGLGLGLTVPVIPELAQRMGPNAETAPLIFAASLAGTFVSALPVGILIDKLGRRRVLLAGLIITAVASLLTSKVAQDGASGSLMELAVYRFILGWGIQMWTMSRITVIADTGAVNQRGKQVTQMFGMHQIGVYFGPIIGGLAAVSLGLWAPFVVHAAVVMAALIPSLYLLRETAPSAPPGQEAGPAIRRDGAWRAMLAAPVSTVLLVAFLMSAAHSGVTAGGVLSIYSDSAYGMRVDGLVRYGVVGMAGIAIVFAAGFVMDRFGRKYTIVPGLILYSGSSMALLAAVTLLEVSYAWFVAVSVLLLMSTYVTSGSTMTLGADVAPEAARGRFFGLLNTVVQVGPVMTGILTVVLFGLEARFAALLSLTGLTAFAGALVVIFLVPETLRREQPAPAAESTTT